MVNRIKRGFEIALLFYAGAALILFLLTVRKETWDALRQLRPFYLASLLVLWVLSVGVDGWKFHILIRGIGKVATDFRFAVELLLVGLFFSAVTPFQSGGFPFQMYLLARKGVSPGATGAVVAVKGFSNLLFFVFLAPLVALRVGIPWVMKPLLVITAITLVVIVGIFLFSSNPHLIPDRWRARWKLVDFVARELDMFRFGFRQLVEGERGVIFLIEVLVLSFLSVLLHLLMVPALLYGLGVEVDPILAMALHVLSYMLLLYMPTPGAAGIAELGGAAIFSLVCPKHLLGIFAVLWRFFTYYLGAVLGGLVYFKMFKELGEETGQEPRPKSR